MDLSHLSGWIDRPDAVADVLNGLRRPTFARAAPRLSGAGTERTTLLYKAWREVNGGSDPDYPAQAIGDCVGHAFSRGVDLLSAVEIAFGRESETYRPTSSEAVYALARVDVGAGELGDDDGAIGAWAARAVSTIGTVARDSVGPYDGARAKLWGLKGLPSEFRERAAWHRVGTVSLVQTYAELEDAIANGYPVPICSNQGFSLERDADGFCDPRGVWNHCMLIIGTRSDGRPGACLLQSWGPDAPSGPRSLDQPGSSFWVDRDVVGRMLAQQDSWALSRFDGYPAQTLPERWGYDGFA